jgi:hypothetical protein
LHRYKIHDKSYKHILSWFQFFRKAGVKSAFNPIYHFTLIIKLHDYISHPKIINYVWQCLNCCVEWGGLYQEIKKGVPGECLVITAARRVLQNMLEFPARENGDAPAVHGEHPFWTWIEK